MGVYDSDTLPVDDDAFLNGGLSTQNSAPTTTPSASLTPEPVDEFAENAIDPMASATPATTPAPMPAPIPEPMPAPAPEPVAEPAPVISPAPEPEPKPEPEPVKPIEPSKPEPVEETKEVSLQPSASFEAEMQKKTEQEANNDDLHSGIGNSSFGSVPSSRPKNPYDEIGHISGMTPSQAMIPDGMLAKNRVKLDDDEEDDDAPKAETMIPSQAMAENFSNAGPLRIPAMEAKPEDSEEETVDDDEPVVVGPVISSAGMESLTEEQAENPTANVQAEKMTMEAKVDNDVSEKPVEETKSDATELKPELESTAKETPATPEQDVNPESKTAESEEKHEEEAKHEPVFFQTTTPAIDMTPSTNTNGVAPHAKNTKPALFIIVGVVALAVVGFIIVLIIMAMNNGGILGFGGDDEIVAENLRKVFFIEDENEKFILFDRDGNRLTDFTVNPNIYSAPSFEKKPAIVVSTGEGEELKYGIIDRDGKMIADFGKYSEIKQVGSAFYAKNEEGEALISATGKVTEVTKVMAYTEGLSGYYLTASSGEDNGYNGGFAVLDDGKINIYNNYLRKIHSYDCAVEKTKCGGEEVHLSVANGVLKDEKDALVVYYNGINHVLEAKTGKELAKLEEAMYYDLQGVDQDKNVYYFMGKLPSDTEYRFKAVIEDKVYLPPKSCELTASVKLNDELVVACAEDSSKTYFLSTDLSVKGLDVTSHHSFYNSNTYIDSENGLKFYRNGKKVKEISGDFTVGSSITRGDYYIIREKCKSSKCNGINSNYTTSYYNLDGGRMIDDYFYTASDFDEVSETAIVAKEEDKEYVIDKKGNKIGGSYSGYISWRCADKKAKIVYYTAYDYTNKKYALFDSKGKTISNMQASGNMICEDGDVYYSSYEDKSIYKNGDDLEIYKATGKGDLVNLEDGYIHVSSYGTSSRNSSRTDSYYTLSGKKFYETARKTNYYN